MNKLYSCICSRATMFHEQQAYFRNKISVLITTNQIKKLLPQLCMALLASISIRHRRPRYLVKTSRDHVRLERNYFELAKIICGRPITGCSHVRHHVVSPRNMRRTSEVGTGTSVVYALHSGYRGNRTLIWPKAPHIRR